MPRWITMSLLALGAVGCAGGGDASPPAVESLAPAEHPASQTTPEREAGAAVEHLPYPFTAEQIRDEMVEGSTVIIRSGGAENTAVQRWTVVGWDPEWVEIKYTDLDGEGRPGGPPQIQRVAWTELQDHASFDASVSTREETTMETPLGELSGWLYTVPDPSNGTLSHFFFATDYPGPPVVLTVEKDGETVMTMEQLDRERPDRVEEATPGSSHLGLVTK